MSIHHFETKSFDKTLKKIVAALFYNLKYTTYILVVPTKIFQEGCYIGNQLLIDQKVAQTD